MNLNGKLWGWHAVNARFAPYSMAEQVPQGMGSGFIWDTKGHVVTNFHVIRGANAIKVTLIDSTTYPAKVDSWIWSHVMSDNPVCFPSIQPLMPTYGAGNKAAFQSITT